MKRFIPLRRLSMLLAFMLCIAMQAGAQTFEDWTSTNHSHSSSSSHTWTLDLKAGDILSFDWRVSSESSCDWLTITINDSQVVRQAGEQRGTYTYNVTTTGTVTIRATYSKDGSVHNGSDTGWVTNLVALRATINDDGITYHCMIDGTARLSSGTSFEGDLEIPESISVDGVDYTVTSVAASAFQNNANLFSVTIPATVTTVGNSAFAGCSSLTDVICEDGTDNLQFGSSVFSNTPFQSLYMGRPFTTTTTANSTSAPFYQKTSLAMLEFGEGATSIPSYAFYGCTGLTDVNIVEDCTQVGTYAFAQCTNLQGVDIQAKAATFGASVFDGDTRISTVNTGNIVNWLGNTFSDSKSNPVYYARRLDVNGRGVTDIVIPSTCTAISPYAFYNAENLQSVTSAEGATSVGRSAFYGCSNLQEVSLPGTVTTIGDYAFANCATLAFFSLGDDESTVQFGSNVFQAVSLENLYLGKGFTTTATANSTDAPFYQKTSIIDFELGPQVSSIPTYGFYGCTGITSVGIPASVTSIGSYAFSSCTNVRTLTFTEGGSVEMTIGNYAFQSLSKLTSLTIPSTVSSIGSYAFSGCSGLTTLNIADATTRLTINNYAFQSSTALATVYMGRDISATTSTNTGYMPFYGKTSLKNLTIGPSVKSIGSYLFRGTGITELTIPANVDSIASYAFYENSSMTRITVEDATKKLTVMESALQSNCVTDLYMGRNMGWYGSLSSSYIGFYGNTYLKNLTIGDKVTYIANRYFQGCTALASLTIPSQVSFVGNYSFYNCTGLKDLTLEEGNKNMTIGDYAFYYTSGITELTIPAKVSSIGQYAFQYTGAKTVTFADGANTLTINPNIFLNSSPTTVYLGRNFTYSSDVSSSSYSSSGYLPFTGKTSITSLTISNQVTSLPTYLFYNCTGLSSITLPSSVSSVAPYAFASCTNLKSIILADGEGSIAFGDNVFSGVTPTTLNLGRDFTATSTNSTAAPFYQKTSLKTLTIGSQVTAIPTYAFYGCTGIDAVVLPNSVETIGSYAFYQCSGMKTLTLPTTLSAIAVYTFYGCTGLTSITLPATLTSIGGAAFSGCTGLTEVKSHIPASVLFKINSSVFANVDKDVCVLHVPEDAISKYSTTTYWSQFMHIVEMMPAYFSIVNGTGITEQVYIRNNGTPVVLNDGIQELLVSEPLNVADFNYVRNFTNTRWQALYVPFAIPYSELEGKFEVAALNDIHQYDRDEDGVIDDTELEVIKVKSGSLEPNVPYVIRSLSTGEKTISLHNVTLEPTEDNSFDVSSWYYLYTFSGTYSMVNDMYTQGHLGFSNGSLVTAASDAETLKAMRWYLDIESRDAKQPKTPAMVRIHVWGEDSDEETEGIGVINASSTHHSSTTSTFDLQGRQQMNAGKGLYIVNGKKIMK